MECLSNPIDFFALLSFYDSISSYYWEYAVLHAVYLINISPSAGRAITPCESIYGEKPDGSDLILFYSPGIPCRFHGYDPTGKDTYVILDLIKRSIIVRKNVIIFGKSLVDYSIPAPDNVDSGGEDRNDYDILLEDPFHSETSDDVFGDDMEEDEDVLEEHELIDEDVIVDEDIPFSENLRSQMDNDDAPYWVPDDKEEKLAGY